MHNVMKINDFAFASDDCRPYHEQAKKPLWPPPSPIIIRRASEKLAAERHQRNLNFLSLSLCYTHMYNSHCRSLYVQLALFAQRLSPLRDIYSLYGN